jgi:hypothetical protein
MAKETANRIRPALMLTSDSDYLSLLIGLETGGRRMGFESRITQLKLLIPPTPSSTPYE